MTTSRRGFLRLLGITAAAAALMPLDELADRAGFAKSPTTSLYVREPGLVVGPTRGLELLQGWEEAFFEEYVRGHCLEPYAFDLPRTQAERRERIVDPKRALVLR
jgi:hypothetical protein